MVLANPSHMPAEKPPCLPLTMNHPAPLKVFAIRSRPQQYTPSNLSAYPDNLSFALSYPYPGN